MRLAYNIFASIGGASVAVLAGVVFLPLFITQLGPEAYGLIGFHTALMGLVAAFDSSYGQVTNRVFATLRSEGLFKESSQRVFSAGEHIAFAGAVITVGGIALLAPYVASSYMNPVSLRPDDIQMAITLSGAALSMRWVQSYYTNVLAGIERQVGVNIVMAAVVLLQYGGGFLLIKFVSPSVLLFFKLMVFTQVGSAAVLRYLVCMQVTGPTKESCSTTYAKFIQNRGFAFDILGTTLLGAVIAHADKFILGALLDLKMFGLYTFCASVASLVMKGAGAVFTATFPRLTWLASQGSQGAELSRHFHIGCQSVSLLVLPTACALTLFAPEVIYFWSGSRELSKSVIPLLPLMVIGNTLNSFAQIPYALQLANGWARLALLQNLVSVMFFVPGVYVLARAFNGEGAAAAWILVNLMYCCLGVPLMHRRLLRGEIKTWLFSDLVSPLLFMCPVFVLAGMIDTSGWSRMAVGILLAATVGVATVCATLGANQVRPYALAKLRYEK